MLNQFDIDNIMKTIQGGNTVDLFYVANKIETREGIIDEVQYKSHPEYKVIKVTISDVKNAYYYYLDYLINPNDYHEESEVEYNKQGQKNIHYYTVKNANADGYTKPFNSNPPSIIYGYRSKLYTSNDTITYINPSPIKPVYTNTLRICNDVFSEWNTDLEWKYINLDNKIKVDENEFKYITSDWYVLTCDNFPRTEDILINTKMKSAYFIDINEAFSYLNQIE